MLSLDYCTFCEMCMEHSLLLSTYVASALLCACACVEILDMLCVCSAHETDVLDTATKASILIQKVARCVHPFF